MEETGLIGLLLILINAYVSYTGLKDPAFFEKYLFRVDEVLIHKDYKRVITSGFLHVSWLHLIFNMMSLYFFSAALEGSLGPLQFLLVYFGSMIGGNLLALFIHRHDGSYSSVGASGAISGIIFASIALVPDMDIAFIIPQLKLPGWLFGLLFVVITIYGIRSPFGNIGHEAHLGGAITGLLIAVIMVPESLIFNYVAILLILIPCIVFIYLAVKRPYLLMTGPLFKPRKKQYYDIDEKYNMEKKDKMKELNSLLDKISRNGINSLSSKERQRLEELSKGR